jgi:hypothetical protein
MASGSLNRINFGNATSVRYGAGGSGDPATREVVHGVRFAIPTGSAADENPATRHNAATTHASRNFVRDMIDLRT